MPPATAQSLAVDLPAAALAEPAAIEVARPVAPPVPPARTRGRLIAPGERWVIPFAVTLAGSLAFFLWQMAEYTTLLG